MAAAAFLPAERALSRPISLTAQLLLTPLLVCDASHRLSIADESVVFVSAIDFFGELAAKPEEPGPERRRGRTSFRRLEPPQDDAFQRRRRARGGLQLCLLHARPPPNSSTIGRRLRVCCSWDGRAQMRRARLHAVSEESTLTAAPYGAAIVPFCVPR